MNPSALPALLLLGALSAAPAAPAAPSLPPDVESRVLAAVDAEMTRQRLPGAIVALQRDGCEPFVVARGQANYRSQTPMRTDLHVRIGSVTKSFVTALVLRLAQQGKLSLDAPISRYVPGVPNGDRVTLRQLANMTSGLDDFTRNPDFAIPFYTNEPFTPAQLVRLGAALPPLFPPGTRWSYSNTNTVLLGRVIEIVTRQPLALALRRNVFRPLGLRETTLPSGRLLPRPFARGYTRQTITHALGDATHYTPTSIWAAGGVVSTVGDLLRAAPFFGTGRPLLDAASQRERTRWVAFPPNSRVQRYGFGLFDFNGWRGHNGGVPGYTTIVWYLPAQKLSLVVSVNTDIHVGPTKADYAYEPASEIGHEITRIVSPHNVAPAAVKVAGSPAHDFN